MSRTIRSVWGSIHGPVPWEEQLAWPPDVFALTDLLLVHADAYRFVSSPPVGAVWPPHDRWTGSVQAGGREWSEAVRAGAMPGPGIVSAQWEVLSKAREVPLDALSRGEPWNVFGAIVTLHALADEACAPLHTLSGDGRSAFVQGAWAMLDGHGSLSRFPPAGVRVLPKTLLPAGGISVRSLARFLSAHTSPVDVKWRRGPFPVAVSPTADAGMTFRALLLPWPLTVESSDFRPVRGPVDTATDAFGFFEFNPPAPLDLDYVRHALRAAQREGGAAIVALPESAVADTEIAALEDTVADFGVSALVAGVRGRVDARTGLGRNYAHIAIGTGEGWFRFEQQKHHRWLLDARQIRQYHLERSLDPGRRWWEAIAVPPHRMEVIDLGGGATSTALICEDLARQDEVAEIIRGIGPTTVWALLLDGPQIASRWSSRYASVLADDPGSTVVAMTSLGMAVRSRPIAGTPSRSIALWKDAERGLKEIELSPDADAVLLVTSEGRETAWTADGRRHADATPRLVLEEIRQLNTGGQNSFEQSVGATAVGGGR